MGNGITNGFDFVARANSHLIRNVDDVLELKNELIIISEEKTKIQMSAYALLLADRLLALCELECKELIEECYEVIRKWQLGEVRFQDALEIAGQFNDLARAEKDPIKQKALRAWGQVAATPHVKWHPLVASEYMIVIINLIFPKDLDRVKEERMVQLELLNLV